MICFYSEHCMPSSAAVYGTWRIDIVVYRIFVELLWTLLCSVVSRDGAVESDRIAPERTVKSDALAYLNQCMVMIIDCNLPRFESDAVSVY